MANRIQARRQFLAEAGDLPLVRAAPPSLSCDECGACCQHMGYPPFCGMFAGGDPEFAELLAVRPDLAEEVRQGARDCRGDQELPCLWLDQETKRCRNYEHRPSICREFEMGSEPCLEHRDRLGIV